MAKFKKQLKRLFSNSWQVMVLVVIGFVAGWLLKTWQTPTSKTALVWAIDDTVKVPNDLRSYLLSQKDDCKGYKGTNSPTGVALWAVLQVEQNKFAKITYGC